MQTKTLSARRAWYAVTLLTLLYVDSFIDRFIVAILAHPLAQDLHLSDMQVGLLIGTGFAILYSIVGLPLAHWIDLFNRRRIIVAAVLLWSLTTIASAMATSFLTLFVLRAGVAIGESVLTPAAVSLIADLFPRGRRTLPMTIYMACGHVMGIGAFMIGGAAFDLASHLPYSPMLTPWRITFFIVGVPGIILGLLLLITVREPTRTGSKSHDVDRPSLRSFVVYIMRNCTFYVPFLFGGGFYYLFGSSLITWLPTILVRGHGFDPAQAGYIYGFFGLPAGVLGVFLWPQLAKRLERRWPMRGVPVTLLIASIAAIPIFVLVPSVRDSRVLIAGLMAATLVGGAWGSMPAIGFLTFGPSRMRAKLMASNFFTINLVGLGFGPLIVVWFSRFWPGDPRALGYGIASVGAISAPGAAFCYLICLRAAGRLETQVT
jgi:MFS family permease